MYHYIGCGLPDVYLENGYKIRSTPYGEGVAIEDLKGLHEAIGRWLVERPGHLSGEEFRFLRREMDLSQKRFAALFGLTEQAVAKWEKKDKVPAWADRNIRLIYMEYLGEKNQNMLALLQFMAELDDEETEQVVFKESDGRWRIGMPNVA